MMEELKLGAVRVHLTFLGKSIGWSVPCNFCGTDLDVRGAFNDNLDLVRHLENLKEIDSLRSRELDLAKRVVSRKIRLDEYFIERGKLRYRWRVIEGSTTETHSAEISAKCRKCGRIHHISCFLSVSGEAPPGITTETLFELKVEEDMLARIAQGYGSDSSKAFNEWFEGAKEREWLVKAQQLRDEIGETSCDAASDLKSSLSRFIDGVEREIRRRKILLVNEVEKRAGESIVEL